MKFRSFFRKSSTTKSEKDKRILILNLYEKEKKIIYSAYTVHQE